MKWYRRSPTLYRFLKSVFGAYPKLKYHSKLRNELLRTKADGELYLIGTNTGGNAALLSFDLLIGIGLRARGKRVKFVLCDGALPACQMCEYSSFSETRFPVTGLTSSQCNACFVPANKLIEKLGFEVIKISDYIGCQKNDTDFTATTQPHSRAGFLRYQARGDFEKLVRESPDIYQHFVEASNISISAYLEIIKTEKPSCVLLHHGIYVPQGPALEAAKITGTRSVTWSVMYRNRSVLLSCNDTYHKTLPRETKSDFDTEDWSDTDANRITSYLHSRTSGKNDWISFSKMPDKPVDVREQFKISSDKEIYLLLTNVIWDANIHFSSDVFDDMIGWVTRTINLFEKMPDKHLFIRVHPAEVTGTILSRQFVEEEINTRFPTLPRNVHVIGPRDTEVDTYTLINSCDVATVYGSKAAIEVAARGKPVIITGAAWARGKGFTFDPIDQTHYEDLLSIKAERLALTTDQKKLALKYAHYLFFERTIQINSLIKPKYFGQFVIDPSIDTIEKIEKDKNLQTIISSLIENKSFVIKRVAHS